MNIILLSGGSGKRLWPLSNDTRSKQFLKLMKNPSGQYESMVQRIYRQIREAGINDPIVVATSQDQQDSIHSQLGDSVEMVIEPERRDTFPAIALSAIYLAMEKGCGMDEVVIVLPVDPYTETSYFETLLRMEEAVRADIADLVLMGIKPTYASEKYGYILSTPNEDDLPQPVTRFVEKPSLDVAIKLNAAGALWNGGVFAFRLRYMVNIVNKYIQPESFEDVRERYSTLVKNSFDYEVVEKASSVAVVPYHGMWKDLGTWNTLTEEMSDDSIGRVLTGEGNQNTHIINELSIPVVVLGVRDIVVAASPDGILVSDKTKSSYLKPYANQIDQRPMYEERRWGAYEVLDYNTYNDEIKSLTKHIIMKADMSISYQSHNLRDEIWIIVDGIGDLLIDGHIRNVRRGDVAYIQKSQKHAIKAISELHIIEVQIGGALEESDTVGCVWEW